MRLSTKKRFCQQICWELCENRASEVLWVHGADVVGYVYMVWFGRFRRYSIKSLSLFNRENCGIYGSSFCQIQKCSLKHFPWEIFHSTCTLSYQMLNTFFEFSPKSNQNNFFSLFLSFLARAYRWCCVKAYFVKTLNTYFKLFCNDVFQIEFLWQIELHASRTNIHIFFA